ncbi:MAG: polymerase subunit delta [Tepidanaerobacteraceae bacterium]|nr:polymerase subunit delta [Tepidanaerobacteraceae bacterium]
MRKIFHAYILLGPEENTAKKAIELAKAANCNKTPSFCDDCDCCRRMEAGSHPDLFHVFPDGSSIKVEKIRDVILGTYQPPIEARRKVYVFHEADKMTQEAQNALLKTLEDPPTSLLFLLLARNLKTLLPTVISRCQILDYSKSDEVKVIPNDLKEILFEIIFDGLDFSKINFYVQKLAGADVESDILMEFMATLYRDILVIKTKSRAGLKNRDLLDKLKKRAEVLSPRVLVKAIETLYSQIEAVKSRGNENLAWYNLLVGLKEQEVM